MNRLALNVINEMNRMQREIDWFPGLGRAPRRGSPFSRVSFHPGRAVRTWPRINISEDADNVYVAALAPGIDPESLDVSMTGDQLTISGEKKALPEGISAEKIHRNERACGRFVRTVTLPSEVDSGRIEASYRSGLLKVTLPKAEAAKPKKIQVSVA